jgi:hypothetical protein
LALLAQVGGYHQPFVLAAFTHRDFDACAARMQVRFPSAGERET